MTKMVGGKGVPPTLPRAYSPERWQLLRNLLAAFPPDTFKASDFFYFAGPLGNSSGNASKFDVGTNGPINLDVIGESWSYPEANYSTRLRIIGTHVEHNLGLLHFLRTDTAVPPSLQADVKLWGFCADEFVDDVATPNFPSSSLYVREARRMVGSRVFTEADHVRNRTKPDSVGVGAYNCDVHMAEIIPVQRNSTAWVLSEGWLTHDFPHVPFDIPYWIMLPSEREASNLLVPVAVSASHVAFGGIRLEATWSVLGHAAGTAAGLAISNARRLLSSAHETSAHETSAHETDRSAGVNVQAVNISALQASLTRQGQLIHAADLPPHSPKVAC